MQSLQKYFTDPLERRRLIMAVFGVLICAVGVALCRMAGFGVDSFQSFCSGVYNVSPLDEGTTYVIINVVLLVFALVTDRHYIGLGTLINLFLFGYVVDFSQQLMISLFGMPALAGRIVYLALGFFVCCAACSIYITADLGVSTYDAISLYLARVTPLHYRFIRIITDVICVVIGWLLGSVPGICTILCAALMGPMISWINTWLSQPLLYGKKGKPADRA